MSNLITEQVLEVHHWDDRLFSFRTTRSPGLRFTSGQFVMIGLEGEKRPLLRAYSVASPNYEDYLEFLSIKVPDGPLTSKLQHLNPGDPILVSKKPTGSLLLQDLLPGKNLYLLSTGTGLAPFMSIVQDPECYEKFEKVILVHGVRHCSELAYADFIQKELPQHEYLGEMVREQLIYYPAVTREKFIHHGRITHLINSGQMFEDIGLPPLDASVDRVMLCGSTAFLDDTKTLIEGLGFSVAPSIGVPGDYVIERAFVEH